jgi:regulator of RNase E activity RraA
MTGKKRVRSVIAIAVSAGVLFGAGLLVRADEPMTAAQYEADPAAMLEAYRRVETGSVSDALEQNLKIRRYMSSRMQAIFTTRFAGYALTVKMEKREGSTAADVQGMLTAIDRGGKDQVYVMQVEDGANIAGIGGLMGTAMFQRGFEGAVIDGGVRDLGQLRKIGFPVYALGPVPSTSVGHYRFVGANIPIVADGVPVNPGDIVVADQDGVVVVPRQQAAMILVAAQRLDYTEQSTIPFIGRFRSIEEAVRQFGRI